MLDVHVHACLHVNPGKWQLKPASPWQMETLSLFTVKKKNINKLPATTLIFFLLFLLEIITLYMQSKDININSCGY